MAFSKDLVIIVIIILSNKLENIPITYYTLREWMVMEVLLYSTSCAGFNIMCTLDKVRNISIINYT